MTDPQSLADERDAQEAKAAAQRVKADAIQVIQDVPDVLFADWWKQHWHEVWDMVAEEPEAIPF